jgi:hypothetical protein
MKIVNLLTLSIVSLVLTQANAQSEAPKGFKKGTIVLADGSNLPGYVKDNIRSNASVVFLAETGGKKKNYNGSDLNTAQIEGTKFICIKGDFFKVLSEGELSFLQKASDASGKPTYNGNEATFSSGTEGKLNDYFIYTTSSKQLKLVSKKNVDEVIAASFAGYTAAIDKAKTVNGDLSQLKDAVEIYNNRNQ